jgi:hypothetical protein
MKNRELHLEDFGISHTSKFNEEGHYDVYKLREYADNFPTVDVSLDTLKHLMSEENDCWTDKEGNRVSPVQIIADWWEAQNNPLWKQHVDKISGADLDYPIWLNEEGHLIDGMHRVTKAFLKKEQTIKAKILGDLPKEALISKEE